LLHVLLAPDGKAHPPGLQQDVVQPCLSRRHQLLAQPHRKRKVGQAAPVQVADLVTVYPKLDPVEPVRHLLDPRLPPYLALDLLPEALHP
jgi:hypothetical protein